MKLKIEIDMSNDAFTDYPKDELTNIFHTMLTAFTFDGNDEALRLRDTNGNTVGKAGIGRTTTEEPE